MNYLAHLVLSGEDSDLRLGNFIGDAVKGDPHRHFAAPIARGIEFHRWIDSYTDDAPFARQVRAALRPMLGKFSGVGVDLLFDHILAKHFDDWYPQYSLRQFATRVQNDLNGRAAEMPLRSQRFLQAMIAHDWLVEYGNREGMLAVCRAMDTRLESRLGVASPLHRLFEAADEAGLEDMERAFQPFWQRMQTVARATAEHQALLAY